MIDAMPMACDVRMYIPDGGQRITMSRLHGNRIAIHIGNWCTLHGQDTDLTTMAKEILRLIGSD
jgi:hypothetical protein